MRADILRRVSKCAEEVLSIAAPELKKNGDEFEEYLYYKTKDEVRARLQAAIIPRPSSQRQGDADRPDGCADKCGGPSFRPCGPSTPQE